MSWRTRWHRCSPLPPTQIWRALCYCWTRAFSLYQEGGRLLWEGEEGGETLTLSAPSAPPPLGGGHPQESGAVGAEPPGWQLGAHNRLSRASRDSSLECSCTVAKSCFLPPPSSPPFPSSGVAPEGAGGLVARRHPCLPSPGLWSWCQAERGAEDFASPVRRMGTRGYPVGREGMSPSPSLPGGI